MVRYPEPWQRHHEVSWYNLALLSGTPEPAAKPFAQLDWPTPLALLSFNPGFVQSGLGVGSVRPFRQLEWATPLAVRRDELGFVFGALSFRSVRPFVGFLWTAVPPQLQEREAWFPQRFKGLDVVVVTPLPPGMQLMDVSVGLAPRQSDAPLVANAVLYTTVTPVVVQPHFTGFIHNLGAMMRRS